MHCEGPRIKYENIDDDFDESFERSKVIYSRKYINESCSKTVIMTEDNLMIPYNLDACSEVKIEQFEDTSFCCEAYKIGSEEASAPCSKTADELSKCRQIHKKSRTPEEMAKRQLSSRKYREELQAKWAKETPEQSAERKLKKKTYRSMETPEQTANRLSKMREYAKRIHMQRKGETPEQAADRLAKSKEKAKKSRQLKLAKETPEQTAKRILESREYNKLHYTQRKAETPEQTAELLTISKSKKFGQKERAKKQTAGISKETENDVIEEKASEEPFVKYENIEDDFNESCTWLSFGGSEGINSRTSIDGSCSRTTTTTEDNSMIQYKSDATSEVKSEQADNSSFVYEIVEFECEEAPASCSKNADKLDNYRRKHKKSITPEKRARQQINNKKYREVLLAKFANETLEQTAERMLKNRERHRKYRSMETPEQSANRLSKLREYSKRLPMPRKGETPEQTAERLAKIKENAKKSRQKKLAKETPEQTAKRLLESRDYNKRHYMQRKAEKPKQTAELLATSKCTKCWQKDTEQDEFEANASEEPKVK